MQGLFYFMNEFTQNHNWYAVITAKVLLSKELSSTQKLLIALISNLSNERGYCFATNKYLGDCLNISEITVSKNISYLEDHQWLGRVIKLNEKREVEIRILTIFDGVPLPSKTTTPPVENNHTPPVENAKDNNKDFNKVSILENEEKKSIFDKIGGYPKKPNAEDLTLLLPEENVKTCIERVCLQTQQMLTFQQVEKFWQVFKKENFTGENFYQSEHKVFHHFSNWIKNQKLQSRINGHTIKDTPQRGTSIDKINALKKW